MRRILLISSIMVVVAILCATWYVHTSRIQALDSGNVFVREQPRDTAKPETPEPAQKNQQPRTQELAPSTGAHTPGGGRTTGRPQATVPPALDTISRNPSSRVIFAGRGKYQLYRQGDITWRLNTDTGEACILFATDAEWSKTRVYQQGCGGRAR